MRLGWPRACAAALAFAGAASGSIDQERTAHHRLDIAALAFEPPQIEVAVGDTITWTNRDVVPHTVTGADGSWDSGELGERAVFELVVHAGDTVRYRCRYHPVMTGTLLVR